MDDMPKEMGDSDSSRPLHLARVKYIWVTPDFFG